MKKSETMRTKFCGNNFLGKGFRKTSADSFFLNSDVASGGGGVWGGILRLLLFLFWRNSGGLKKKIHIEKIYDFCYDCFVSKERIFS